MFHCTQRSSYLKMHRRQSTFIQNWTIQVICCMTHLGDACIGTITYIIMNVYTCSLILLMDLRKVWNMCGTHFRQWLSGQTDMYYIWMERHKHPFIMLNNVHPYFHMSLELHTRGKIHAPKTCTLGMYNYIFSMHV